jgi:Tfp pilus assembly protein PilN
MAGFRTTRRSEEEPAGNVMIAPAPMPIAAPTAAFPRVNLLPQEIAEQAKVRRARLALVGVAAVAALLIAGLYISANNDVADAQTGLAAVQQTSSQLAAQQAALANVPVIYAQVAAAQAQVVVAMGGEVRWSYELNNLALTIPAGVSINSYKAVLNLPSANGAPVGSTLAGGAPPVGTVDFVGEAKSYNQVAAWLDSLAKQPTYNNPYPSSVVATAATKDRPAITFSNTVNLGSKALSHRYDATSQTGN